MKLTVNGDDFGFSPGQNLGIIKAHTDGILTSTSLMANGAYVEEAVALSKQHPSLAIGVHLIIDYGYPVLPKEQVKTLVNQDGHFLRFQEDAPLPVLQDEVFNEWCAQIDKIITLGVKPTHLDGHHHMHLHPSLLATTLKVAKKYQLPMRYFPFYHGTKEKELIESSGVNTYLCLTGFYQDGVDLSYFTAMAEKYHPDSDQILEVMCHPAYVDDLIYTQSSYVLPRIKELVILTDEKTRRVLDEQGILLGNVRDFGMMDNL